MKLDFIYTEDSLKGIPGKLPDSSIDLITTDPPYGIAFMGRSWDKFNEIVRPQGAYEKKKGFKKLPRQSSAFILEYFTPIWRECLRVLKPGAFAFVMCIPRQDCLARMIMSLDDAGFWVGFTPMFHAFASGFPKAQNVGKFVDKKLGAEKIIGKGKAGKTALGQSSSWNKTYNPHEFNITEPNSPQAQALDGSYAGFQPKPAVEVILVAMKPLSEKTYVDQALQNRKGITWLGNGRIPYRNSKDIDNAKIGFKGNILPPSKGWNENKVQRTKFNQQNGRFPANLLCGSGIDVNLEALIEAKNKL